MLDYPVFVKLPENIPDGNAYSTVRDVWAYVTVASPLPPSLPLSIYFYLCLWFHHVCLISESTRNERDDKREQAITFSDDS